MANSNSAGSRRPVYPVAIVISESSGSCRGKKCRQRKCGLLQLYCSINSIPNNSYFYSCTCTWYIYTEYAFFTVLLQYVAIKSDDRAICKKKSGGILYTTKNAAGGLFEVTAIYLSFSSKLFSIYLG